jgi:tetratricopeptide (TPR) repeat protein
MKEIMGYRALAEAGDREGLIALLTRYIDPRMEKHNRMVVEGYDPRLCINKSGDYVFDLAMEPGDLNDIKDTVKLLHKGRYGKYRAKLKEHLQDYPNLSYLHVGIGNSHFAEGDLAAAQQWYRQGASANPMNPMLGYSMAFCHLAAGDEARAIEALIGSVTVCRNNLLAWLALDCLLSAQGGRVIDQRFRNRTYTGWDGVVMVDEGVPPRMVESWVYFGAAEIAINSRRSELLDVFDTWDIEEFELYKLAHLLGMYVIQKGEPGGIRDSYLENLLTIHEEGYLKQYVLFEMIAPYTRYHLTSTASPEDKRMLREYIDRFVARR